MTLLPIMLLSSPLVTITRNAAVRLLALAVMIPLLMAALSPAIAIIIHREGVPITQAITGSSRRRSTRLVRAHDRALRIVGSYTKSSRHRVLFRKGAVDLGYHHAAQTPWVTEDRIKREGIAIVCPVPESYCVQAMNTYAAPIPTPSRGCQSRTPPFRRARRAGALSDTDHSAQAP